MTTLHLAGRIAEGAMTGFSLDEALKEAAVELHTRGYWSNTYSEVVDELRGAILAAVERAINEQGIDAEASRPDFELTEMIRNSTAFGFAKGEGEHR